jgi:hypothetical protein
MSEVSRIAATGLHGSQKEAFLLDFLSFGCQRRRHLRPLSRPLQNQCDALPLANTGGPAPLEFSIHFHQRRHSGTVGIFYKTNWPGNTVPGQRLRGEQKRF